MADKRIYELDATNTAQSGDFFAIDSEGEGTRKITKSNLLGGIEEDVQALKTKVGTAALTTTAQDCSGAINELKDTTDDTTNMMSDAYDNTATYVVGDIVIYDGALYKCNTDISTAEDFDSTKWDATTIDAELSSLNSSITNLSIGEQILFVAAGSIPSSPTSKSLETGKSINDYDFLLFRTGHYYNIYETVLVPVDEFTRTDAGSRIYMVNRIGGSDTLVEIYYNTATKMYVKGSGSYLSATTLYVYGIMKNS
jgi:hypothetical protein